MALSYIHLDLLLKNLLIYGTLQKNTHSRPKKKKTVWKIGYQVKDFLTQRKKKHFSLQTKNNLKTR